MGLDMHLLKESIRGVNSRFVSEMVGGGVHTQGSGLRVSGEFANIADIDTDRVYSIMEEVGRWRNAYFLHEWIVNNANDGFDAGDRFRISFEVVKKLRDTILSVTNGDVKPEDVLPLPGYEVELEGRTYDDQYYELLRYTFAITDEIVSRGDGSTNDVAFDYYYHANW